MTSRSHHWDTQTWQLSALPFWMDAESTSNCKWVKIDPGSTSNTSPSLDGSVEAMCRSNLQGLQGMWKSQEEEKQQEGRAVSNSWLWNLKRFLGVSYVSTCLDHTNGEAAMRKEKTQSSVQQTMRQMILAGASNGSHAIHHSSCHQLRQSWTLRKRHHSQSHLSTLKPMQHDQ